jgi:hypothetical protein
VILSDEEQRQAKREHNNFYPTRESGHRERLLKKMQTRDGLQGLYDEWKAHGYEPDHPYMLHLVARIKKVENQLKNMRP